MCMLNNKLIPKKNTHSISTDEVYSCKQVNDEIENAMIDVKDLKDRLYSSTTSSSKAITIEPGIYLLYVWVNFGAAKINPGLYAVVLGTAGDAFISAIGDGTPSASVEAEGTKVKISAPFGHNLGWYFIKL